MADLSRMDLSQFGSMSQLAGSIDVSGLLDQLQARSARAAEVRERIGELVGRAESDDGYIAATYTAADGLQGLTLDPKAMRLASQDLAAEIVRLGAEARLDLERRRAEVLAELGMATGQPDLERSQADLAELRAAFAGGASDVQAVVERLRAQVRR